MAVTPQMEVDILFYNHQMVKHPLFENKNQPLCVGLVFMLSLSKRALSSHFSAFIRTLSADVRTFLAVRILELGAFLGTGLTDCCAQFTELFGVIAVSGHIARSDGANLGTIPENLNAMYPGLHVRFIQTRSQALFTNLHTLVTQINAGLISFYIRIHNGGHPPHLLSSLIIFDFAPFSLMV